MTCQLLKTRTDFEVVQGNSTIQIASRLLDKRLLRDSHDDKQTTSSTSKVGNRPVSKTNFSSLNVRYLNINHLGQSAKDASPQPCSILCDIDRFAHKRTNMGLTARIDFVANIIASRQNWWKFIIFKTE